MLEKLKFVEALSQISLHHYPRQLLIRLERKNYIDSNHMVYEKKEFTGYDFLPRSSLGLHREVSLVIINLQRASSFSPKYSSSFFETQGSIDSFKILNFSINPQSNLYAKSSSLSVGTLLAISRSLDNAFCEADDCIPSEAFSSSVKSRRMSLRSGFTSSAFAAKIAVETNLKHNQKI